MYIEGVTNARKFMSAARHFARTKPIIVVKAGKYSESARAVASHTGSLTGEDDVYEAAFKPKSNVWKKLWFCSRIC
jgi:acetyltransferase